MEQSGIDDNGDMRLSREELNQLLEIPEASRAIQDVGVDPIGLVDYTDFIFEDSLDESISFQALVQLILELRGSNTSTVKDVVDVRKCIMHEFCQLKDMLDEQAASMNSSIVEVKSLMLKEKCVSEKDTNMMASEIHKLKKGFT